MIQTFVGVRGPGARRLFETARRLGASVVLAEPELTVLARPGLLDAHSDGQTTTLVRADAPVGTEGAAEAFANAFARFGEEAMQAYTRPAAVVHWDKSGSAGSRQSIGSERKASFSPRPTTDSSSRARSSTS